MVIKFKTLCQEAGITQSQFARELVAAGIFVSIGSARTTMYYNGSGKNKSIDKDLLEFSAKRFNKTFDQIITNN